jgi:hypothetical protein
MSPFRTKNDPSRCVFAPAMAPAVPNASGSVIHRTVGGAPFRDPMNEWNVDSRYGDEQTASSTPCAAR